MNNLFIFSSGIFGWEISLSYLQDKLDKGEQVDILLCPVKSYSCYFTFARSHLINKAKQALQRIEYATLTKNMIRLFS
tara:strand:+ start:4622 stop:4855 length:234 start_codon:yes stop_codon:yes gene_type:complete